MAFFEELKTYEATRIARTEAGCGCNVAADIAMERAGATKKRWVRANAGQESRHTHLANEAEGEIDFLARFRANGMSYPHENGAPAGEVINCMCVHVATGFE
jgi:hypothetical protein